MRSGWLGIVLFLCATLANAQFKWVDSGGRVGYGDKPPAGAHDIESLQGVSRGARTDPLARLPYQLQRTMKDFPVTLYTMSECPACDRARTMLKSRAVPFVERTVRNGEDTQALKKLTGSDQLPAFQVGNRTMIGFNSSTWDETLDAAGYPHENQLPADWAWPAPEPLTVPGPAQPAASEGAAPPAQGNGQ